MRYTGTYVHKQASKQASKHNKRESPAGLTISRASPFGDTLISARNSRNNTLRSSSAKEKAHRTAVSCAGCGRLQRPQYSPINKQSSILVQIKPQDVNGACIGIAAFHEIIVDGAIGHRGGFCLRGAWSRGTSCVTSSITIAAWSRGTSSITITPWGGHHHDRPMIPPPPPPQKSYPKLEIKP